MSDSSSESGVQGRVRLHSVEVEETRDGRCLVRLWVEWVDGSLFEGQGEGSQTPEGRLRAGADAAVEAAGRVTGALLLLEMKGVKLVKAFDGQVAIASLRGRSPRMEYELLGCAAAPEEGAAQGGILAILDATNRILARYADQNLRARAPE
jgi:hypothetical protein